MNRLVLRHSLACDEKTYWEKCVFNEEHNHRLYMEQLGFVDYRLLEQQESQHHVQRRISLTPSLKWIHPSLKKWIGKHFSYIEEGTFDRSRMRYQFSVIPSVLANKTKISGTLHCEFSSPREIHQVVQLHIDIQVFGVGSLLEERVMADLKQSYGRAHQFTAQFLLEYL
ncbi:DUF2505 family protein [Pajaroellobacter abortibovis]|uniref:DUF2505 domain-containing protein n=1 Tax=Pajaroellobacter abortibovis TaxID=1882918 RepID=A0A1L6MYQ3_9BACT|nr:DUF2505 family protein [Pajaroellobacter abortibovis]APS00642.1 hypothetical protein BCY86_08125 [Pajaroellobacter abortibovis]